MSVIVSVPAFQAGSGFPSAPLGHATMLSPETVSLSIGTHHVTSVAFSRQIGLAPRWCTLATSTMFGTMHSEWRSSQRPLGSLRTRLYFMPSAVLLNQIAGQFPSVSTLLN